MPFTLTVPDQYGYAALVALGAIPLLSLVQGIYVGVYRKAAGIPYPNPYASQEQAKTSRAAYQFNCAQRAHGNLLENITQVTGTILFSALFYPRAATAIGATWVFFRILYTYGYITSTTNGKERSLGSLMWLAQIALWGMSIAGAVTLM